MTATGRERTRRTAAGAVLAALTTVALAACQGPDAEPATTPSPEQTPVETLSPAPSASPSPETWPPPQLDDMPLAAPIDDEEPAVYEPTDWLWDWVDDTWSTAIYSTAEVAPGPDGSTDLQGVQHLYLVAPDGTAFRIADLGLDGVGTIVDWDPTHRTAWVHLRDFTESWDIVEVDLVDGVVNDGDFTDGAGPRSNAANGVLSADIVPQWAGDDGSVLWIAVSPFGDFGGGVRYQPESATWTALPMNDVLGDLAEARLQRGDEGPASSVPLGGSGWLNPADGRYVVMAPDRGASWEGTETTYLIVDSDVDVGTMATTPFSSPQDHPSCSVEGPADNVILVRCSDSSTATPDSLWTVDPATGEASRAADDAQPDRESQRGNYTEEVKNQGATPPNADAWADLMPAPASAGF